MGFHFSAKNGSSAYRSEEERLNGDTTMSGNSGKAAKYLIDPEPFVNRQIELLETKWQILML